MVRLKRVDPRGPLVNRDIVGDLRLWPPVRRDTRLVDREVLGRGRAVEEREQLLVDLDAVGHRDVDHLASRGHIKRVLEAPSVNERLCVLRHRLVDVRGKYDLDLANSLVHVLGVLRVQLADLPQLGVSSCDLSVGRALGGQDRHVFRALLREQKKACGGLTPDDRPELRAAGPCLQVALVNVTR